MVSLTASLQKGLVRMVGFEPTQPEAPVLQTGLIRHHQSILPVYDYHSFDRSCQILIHYNHSTRRSYRQHNPCGKSLSRTRITTSPDSSSIKCKCIVIPPLIILLELPGTRQQSCHLIRHRDSYSDSALTLCGWSSVPVPTEPLVLVHPIYCLS